VTKKEYETPRIREVGSLQQLTQQQYNKVGFSTDIYSQQSNNEVVGSMVPVP
jgi:hypothetical protein